MHKPILRRVGLVLLVANLFALASMIYSMTRGQSVSFDFTFLVAGIAMMFGSLSWAHYIRPLSAFSAGALVCYAVYWTATEALALLMAKPRLQAWPTVEDLAFYAFATVIAAWTARELSRPEVTDDPAYPMTFWTTPWLAFAGGIGVCTLLLVFGQPKN